MQKNSPRTARGIVFGILTVLFFSWPGPAPAESSSFSVEQEKDIERIVRDYLRRKPEVLLEAIEALRGKQEGSIEERSKKVIAARKDELFKDPDAPVGGNPNGDITLVEFFDYRCGFCKRVYPSILKLLKEDGNVKFVFKEFPILGRNSVYAARAALASRSQGKYLEFHDVLMKSKGSLGKNQVHRLARSIGLDVDVLTKEMNRKKTEIGRIIDRNLKLADELEITGTPAFVIGDDVIRGAVTFETLKELVAEERAKAKK